MIYIYVLITYCIIVMWLFQHDISMQIKFDLDTNVCIRHMVKVIQPASSDYKYMVHSMKHQYKV